MSIKDEWDQQQKQAVADVLAWAGDCSTLGKLVGVSTSVVHGWVKRGRISATAAIDIERVSGGKFKKRKLRPDVHGWRDER